MSSDYGMKDQDLNKESNTRITIEDNNRGNILNNNPNDNLNKVIQPTNLRQSNPTLFQDMEEEASKPLTGLVEL